MNCIFVVSCLLGVLLKYLEILLKMGLKNVLVFFGQFLLDIERMLVVVFRCIFGDCEVVLIKREVLDMFSFFFLDECFQDKEFLIVIDLKEIEFQWL